jgi:glutamate carboxypeptidase
MIDSLRQYLETQRASFLADLATLVNIDCGTYSKPGVDAVGLVMTRLLEASGFRVERLPVAEYGDCLVARMAGRGQGRVLLVGHLDTVYPDGTVAERPLRVEGSKAIGPGSCDMKGGLLAGVYAARALREVGFDNFAELTFFLNSEEEVGSPVARELYAPEVRQADAALVLEAARGNGAIVSARKGSGTFVVRVSGVSAHAGVAPERGANAILQLSYYIQAIQALNGMRPGLTTNVGVVKGGMRPNVVPDYAEAEVDFRVVRAEDLAVLEDAMAALMAEVRVPRTSSTLSGGGGMPPMEKMASTGMLADLARGVAGELGFSLEDVATGGASDANHIAALGTPVLDGLGPIGQQAHSPDEYLDIDSIVPRTALLAGLIARIAANREQLAALRPG